ncbi:hypothetical protein QTL97_16860 [Sporosarcina thermotolerans]|uniref:DUF4044 domain-containing protein n=1 Tax=Sporosarcina thermotolerans TaxID=633404 RepID=A0AAW9ADC9_9BACL|nr:hypothetical protein [Sporosarcina thermotolerans]MDW0118598.1 hypothetical protein [Sporosarcina thermotolerans]
MKMNKKGFGKFLKMIFFSVSGIYLVFAVVGLVVMVLFTISYFAQ